MRIGIMLRSIDEKGGVLLHSDMNRNLQENLLDKTDNHRRLREAIAEGARLIDGRPREAVARGADGLKIFGMDRDQLEALMDEAIADTGRWTR